MRRRRLLRLISSGGLAGLAGCSSGDPTPDLSPSRTTGSGLSTAASATPSPSPSETESAANDEGLELPWTQLPGPPGGPVTDVAVAPADPDWIYSTTKTAGMFVSSSGGNDWIQGLSGMHHRNQVWVSPHDPEVAYAPERTDDGGRHWYGSRYPEKHRFPESGPGIGDITWDPFDKAILYGTSSQGLYRSFDGGQNWEITSIGPMEGDRLTNIAVHPGTEGVLIAGLPDVGVARSTDRGDSWSIVPGSGELPSQFFKGLEYGDAAEDEIYLAMNGQGVYRLADGALVELTADLPSLAFPAGSQNFSARASGVYFIAGRLDRDPWTDRRLYSYEADSGRIVAIETPERPSAFAAHPDRENTIYVGGIRWVFKSEDNGRSWEALSNGFVDHYLSTVGVNRSSPSTVIPGSACSTGITVSRDSGQTFNWKRSGLEPYHEGPFNEHYVRHVEADGEFAYATTDAGLLFSHDNGRNWELLTNEFSGAGNRPGGGSEPARTLDGLAIDPTDPRTVYVGTGIVDDPGSPRDHFEGRSAIWKSADAGRSWTEKTTGFPTDQDTVVNDILVSRHDRETVYAATGTFGEERTIGAGLGIFRSGDGGSRWTQLPTPFDSVTAIAEHADDPAVLFASTPSGVFKTADAGESWRRVLDHETRALLAHPTDPAVVFAGAHAAEHYWDVLVSTDGGDTWTDGNLTIQVGLDPDRRAYDAAELHSDYWNDRGQIMWFAFDAADSLLYAATQGVGLWRADASSLES